jgi:hypothetical protein
VPTGSKIKLSDLEDGKDQVSVIEAKSRANAIYWGFTVLALTIIGGLIAYVVLDVNHLETNTLREWLQTTIAGETGLLAGLFGSRDRS